MHLRFSLFAGVTVAALSLVQPLYAQSGAPQGDVAGPSSERVRQVIVYGDDPCPQGNGDEIVVCGRQEEKERYRIPKEVREAPDFGSTKNETWSNRVKSIEYVGRDGTESCTPSGLGGTTGCFTQIAAKAKAERRMTGDKSWADQVAAERERRLSGIDAESQDIEDRVKAEEAARTKAEAEAATKALEHQNDPGK